MTSSAEHVLDELSKKLVDDVLPAAEEQLLRELAEQDDTEPAAEQKTPPSSLNDSVEHLEEKLINADESSSGADERKQAEE
uniref:Uncharacterized protein n=1 Tax=Caenorhabditis japonica TaxID=281687 RepID=A0A8R1I0J9_CAEJA